MIETQVRRIADLTASLARFPESAPAATRSAASDFARYKFRSLDAVKRSDREARKYFPRDLRMGAKRGFDDLSFIVSLFGRLPVNFPHEQAGDKSRYAEVETPFSDSAFVLFIGSLWPDPTGPVHVQLGPTRDR